MKQKDLLKNGHAFLVLPIILTSIMVFTPMVLALVTSFQSGPPVNMRFSGLGNYQRVLTDTTFKKAFFNTFLYLLVQIPIMLFLTLFISNLLNDKKLEYKGLFQTAIFLSCIISMVNYSLIMKSLFFQSGLVNNLSLGIGMIDTPIGWLTHLIQAKVPIILSIAWRWTGYNMVFFLSSIQSIDSGIYEAASIGGVSKWQQFIKVMIPDLKPIILFTSITSTIGILQLFDEVQSITGRGPASITITLSQYIYNSSYKFTPNFGYTAVVPFVIVAFIVTLSMIQTKVGGGGRRKAW